MICVEDLKGKNPTFVRDWSRNKDLENMHGDVEAKCGMECACLYCSSIM